MGIKLWQKLTVGVLGLIVLLVLVAGSLTQIGQGHFLNPPDRENDTKTSTELTFAEKVEKARKNLNFGQ